MQKSSTSALIGQISSGDDQKRNPTDRPTEGTLDRKVIVLELNVHPSVIKTHVRKLMRNLKTKQPK